MNKKIKKYSIPIFVPELACPHQCVFCNQDKITGKNIIPDKAYALTTINNYLETIDYKTSHVEVAFFGGNFTGIELSTQINFLELVQPFINKGIVKGIRISTRPDYISEEILERLKKYNVKVIELGAQSLDKEVLIKAGRGHSVEDVIKASKNIKKYGFELGLQMMIGLPGDTLEKSIYTAKKIVELKADNTRIYPSLVIKDTKLAKMFYKGKYKPLSLEDAINWTAKLIPIFEKENIEIIRVGLHPSEGLLNGTELIEGPFHVSFRELVLTEIWNKKFKKFDFKNNESIIIEVPEKEFNYAVGYKCKNKNFIMNFARKVKFLKNKNLTNREFNVIYS